MSYRILPTELRKLTHLHPKMDNETGWSSNYEMLKCYLEMKDFLLLLNMDGIDDLLIFLSENHMVQHFCFRLKKIKEVTVDFRKT